MRSNDQTITTALADLERTARATILTLLRSDCGPEEFDHVNRVAHLSASVAMLCGTREPNLSTIEWAALLHESCSAVSCCCALTMHGPGRPARCGHVLDLARHVPAFATSVELVLALQRVPTGRGRVPAAAPLPFGARVVAVCDGFDELTGGRLNAASAAAALAMIAGRPEIYDPEIVTGLRQLLGIEERGQATEARAFRARVLRNAPRPPARARRPDAAAAAAGRVPMGAPPARFVAGVELAGVP